MALHVLEAFNWHLRRAAHPSRLLPVDYRDLCPYFLLDDAEDAARDFQIPKLVQAVFYAMVVNEALSLGVLSRSLAEDPKSALTTNRSARIAVCRPGQSGARARPMRVNSREESYGSNNAPPLPSDDDDGHYVIPSFGNEVVPLRSERKLARTKQTARPKIVPELMAEGFSAGNSQSSSESLQRSFKGCSTSTSSSEREGKVRSSGSRYSASMAKRRRPQEGQSHEIVAEGTCFLGALEHSDP
ncbi:hypothetical protein Cgig2_033985 [Carnegiea gigantea]|uniref:Uncharacterized protein n=1 Tax=Carnegiea gigantea TaxID=171969 RepID=A0A9Q1JUI1_9CARY|nr:hypothetical protein Cgig2_033985 [Carnegiea gigantea]